ncbi:hypothetical protein PoB_004863200, partial [Plakobranchus ocellatus]
LVDEALCHHVQGSRTKAKQKILETSKRQIHAETPQAEADVGRLSLVDEALCHHVQGSRTKAKQKILETSKRQIHAETPQAEADMERQR